MAMRVGGERGGAIAEINVTPMADVMIVLLIIFMVTLPIMLKSPVPLPPAVRGVEKPSEQIAIWIKSSGEIGVDKAPFGSVEALSEYLRAKVEVVGSPSQVLIQADRDVAYAQVARVLDVCRRAGVDEIGLAVEKKIGS